MTNFIDTPAGQAWIATGPAKETSPEIMAAIAFFADDQEQADLIWAEGPTFSGLCLPLDLYERVTEIGTLDHKAFTWGAAGTDWWEAINV